jgi:hypothetical protein
VAFRRKVVEKALLFFLRDDDVGLNEKQRIDLVMLCMLIFCFRISDKPVESRFWVSGFAFSHSQVIKEVLFICEYI